MKLKLIMTPLIFALLPLSCVSSKKAGIVEKRYTKFGITMPDDQWRNQAFRGADLFFEHKEVGATIFINSECRQVSDSPLVALRSQLLVGVENIDIIDETRIKLSGREALISEMNVKIDGVPRFLKVMILRKNRCVFDAVLSAPKNLAKITKDFDSLISSFWAEASL